MLVLCGPPTPGVWSTSIIPNCHSHSLHSSPSCSARSTPVKVTTVSPCAQIPKELHSGHCLCRQMMSQPSVQILTARYAGSTCESQNLEQTLLLSPQIPRDSSTPSTTTLS